MEELVASDQIYICSLLDANSDIHNPYVYLIDPPNTSHQRIKSQFPGLQPAHHFKSFIWECAFGEYKLHVIFKQP